LARGHGSVTNAWCHRLHSETALLLPC
jgi:hypothetical protein